jgi:hypothetical protein
VGIILIDGPEKAGKTTLAREVVALDPEVRYRHWTQPSGYAEYLRALYEDLCAGDVVVWDRGWPSDAVYGELMPAGTRRFPADPWLGEWLLGRAVDTSGLRVVLAPSTSALIYRRADHQDPTDHKVNPIIERDLYVEYGERFGYAVRSEIDAADLLTAARLKSQMPCSVLPPRYSGPAKAKVVFVGEARKERSAFPLPFITPMTTQYGRLLGDAAMECGWTNVDAHPSWLRDRELVVACGNLAIAWCHRNGVEAEPVPHPAWLYRWASGRQKIEETEARIVSSVSRVLGRGLTPAPVVPGAFPGYDNEERFRPSK